MSETTTKQTDDRHTGWRTVRHYAYVVRAQVDPVAGMAEIEYDPDLCSLSRILAELEVDGPPQEPPGSSAR